MLFAEELSLSCCTDNCFITIGLPHQIAAGSLR
jgi:hypothetical protein